MRRYYITDRSTCPGSLLDCIEENARRGCSWIQLREKDLAPRDLLDLARAALARVRPYRTAILVNSRLDVALAAGADGVPLPAGSPAPRDFRPVLPTGFLIAVSAHSVDEVCRAELEGADFAVFGPVFPTRSKPGLDEIPGLAGLREACAASSLPVAALGGITAERAATCAEAGAAGIAGISMFQSLCGTAGKREAT
ncbi:MAG: thiamine phosphate synthase [Bryobacterales bacterium]|nr:thiamine phosphate synthase [Bryobacterales bacterium]